MNILIIQISSVENVILALPLAQLLKERHPNANIHLMVNKDAAPLLQNHPALDNVWIWDSQKSKIHQLRSLVSRLRQVRYTEVYCLQRDFYPGIISIAVKARKRIGFTQNPLSLAFHRKVSYKLPHPSEAGYLHEVQRNLQLLSKESMPIQRPVLYPGTEDELRIAPYVSQSFYVVAPGAQRFTKKWPIAKWKELLERLPLKYPVYIVGSEGDKEWGCQLTEHHPLVKNLCGDLTLLQTAALMNHADNVFVCDSLWLQLASAVNAPTTTIYCSTIPAFGYGPLATVSKIVETPEPLACRPCSTAGRKACPEGHFKCAYNIPARMVFTASQYQIAMQKHYTDAEKFQTAIRFLNEGKIILHNTDTIPGLAAKALREDAVDRLFEIKQRKASKAMLLLCADMRMVKDYVQEIPSLAFEALDKAGDQPLTMIYPVAKNLPSSVPATDHSIAIRIPQSALLQAFIRMLGAPLVSTSANLSGMPTALTLEEVSEEVKAQVDFILDTSLETATSQSSTLLKIQEDTVTIIREGAMNPAFRDWIAGILG